jgi:hypothetical protein
VVLGRPVVELVLQRHRCTLEELLDALAVAEPRIARYLRGEDGGVPAGFRPLLGDHLLEPGDRIPDGGIVTLVYAVAGGSAP